MKKKIKVLTAFSLLLVCMSSCVYSLFPIYTEDTLVYLPELVGRWETGYDEDDYIQFESMSKDENIVIGDDAQVIDENEPSNYIDSLSGNGWSIKSGDKISVTHNGKVITDRDAVRAHYDTLIGKGSMIYNVQESMKPMVEELEKEMKPMLEELEKEMTPVLEELSSEMGKLAKRIEKQTAKFEGTAYVVKEESYKMTVMDDGERLVYQAHVVRIGEDFFLDLYPLPEFSGAAFGENLFPVHTFMKMDLTDGKLNLTMFDLEKLNKLFESNLVRLRHENVDGTILITAQPKEIQKFLQKYADDESVFESIETYSRILE